jgi:peptidoglycan hydrolase CwlO-like protein
MSLATRAVAASEKKEVPKIAPPWLPAKRSEPIKLDAVKVDPKPEAPPLGAATLPAKGEMKKTGPILLNSTLAPPTISKSEMRKTGVIKLIPPTTESPAPEESIFAEIPEPSPAPRPEGWKKLETGELPLPAGGLKKLDAFEHSQRLDPKPVAIPPVPAMKETPPLVSPAPPPLRQPQPSLVEARTKPVVAPPPLAEPAGKTPSPLNPAPVALPGANPLSVAPPLVEKPPEVVREKLPPPILPEPAKTPAPEVVVPAVAKAPALIEPETPPPTKPAVLPPPLPTAKPKDKLKKTAPIVLTNTSRVFLPGASETKPLLRPAVLPRRATLPPSEPTAEPPPLPAVEAKAPVELPKVAVKPPVVEPAAKVAPTKVEPTKTSIEPSKVSAPEAKSIAPALIAAAGAAGAAVAPALSPKKPFLPPTRAERAKKRRVRGVVLFWVLTLATAVGLFFGILHFGRDTRVEGQIIPPNGMALNDEVWIVSNFSSLASGVADDLAKERVPLQQEIQEAQDHVQRVQADIASREERIRLIQEEVQATKDEINNIVKKSRDEMQAMWDNEGADIDHQYENKLASLKESIAERAASLKLQYAPDPAFPSPEVWANAYRLALYQVPPGVDTVKEHQWLSDQMKQWRDFEKSLDARKEQLREKAAQLKLEPAPKLADLNAKTEDLNQRIAGTQAEEEPLKAELTQAQGDLAAAQAAEASLDDKYYGQLYALPSENISYHIPVKPNGRFTWVPDNPFGDGEVRHLYWIFARATRADGRQYWALQQFPMEKDKTTEMTIEPGGFISTKAILRPNLSPDEIEQ